MIYLDAAATTLQKPSAVARASGYAMGHMASPGRGGHPPAMLAADTVFACRERAAELFHVSEPDDVVFTMNATHVLNIAIKSIVKPGDTAVSYTHLDVYKRQGPRTSSTHFSLPCGDSGSPLCRTGRSIS